MNQNELKNLFKYDAETGLLYWKVRTSLNTKVGKVAGTHNHWSNYIYIKIDNKIYPAHKLVWLYHHGAYPSGCIDHVNGIRNDNRIDNLRHATRAQNSQNMRMFKSNTSGVKVVDWQKCSQRWRVRLQVNHNRINIGSFDCLELAELVANEARAKYHKEFARDK